MSLETYMMLSEIALSRNLSVIKHKPLIRRFRLPSHVPLTKREHFRPVSRASNRSKFHDSPFRYACIPF